MYKFLATAAVALSVATPALAQSVPEKTGVNSTLGISPSTQDFVTEAANSDMLPSVTDKAHGAKLDKLNSLNGADFTKAYEDMQVSAHKDAVSLFERYAKGGDNVDLKAFAAKTLPHLQDHLKMAQDLNK
jgi:putative membrane protein